MRIGIILTGDYSWAGGVYYSLNIIRLLHDISLTTQLTTVVIVNSTTPSELIAELPKKNTELAYLDRKPFLYRLWHRLRDDRFAADINGLNLDVLYPVIAWHPSHRLLNCKVIYWLYDFQHKFLPELFAAEELKKRDQTFQDIADYGSDVVFSSKDSQSHFEQFYSKSDIVRHVYNFVSLLDKKNTAAPSLKIPDNYFIVCNQFWPHKNHNVVLRALKLLVENKDVPHFVFTGKHDDPRAKTYVDELKKFVSDHHLESYVTLTGFISRDAQVALMAGSRAVIQPSFFEGWSTVVEDAKAMNKFLIAASLPVNKEQVQQNVLFFDPTDEVTLADHIRTVQKGQTSSVILDYNINIQRSKSDLKQLFNI